MVQNPLGLYIHVPFCRARCSYCAFYTVSHDEAGTERFVRAVVREIERFAAEGRSGDDLDLPPPAGRLVDTVYLGGGTPSLLEKRHLARLMTAVRTCFSIAGDAEVTLEANPETVTSLTAEAWMALGITRVSVGAQTFHAETLHQVGRLHGPDTIRSAVHHLRRAGCRNLSLDLIAGLIPKRFERDLREACSLSPDHLSVYLLEVDEEEVGAVTGLARRHAEGRARVPGGDWYADAYPRAVDLLAEEGLERYEICNFARPGHTCLHNLKYWRDHEVLGFGPAAHSLYAGVRFANVGDRAAYETALEAGMTPPCQVDRRTPAEADAETAFLALRLCEGIPRRRLERLLAAERRPHVPMMLDELLENGLLQHVGSRMVLSTRGVLVSNEIFHRFLP